MRYSQRWWGTVALLFAFAWTVSAPTAQTEDPSGVSAPSSAEVQSDSVGAQPSSDEPEQKQPTLAPNRGTPADVEMDRRFNELRRELLDDRAKTLDWWLATTAIFLTFLAIIIPLAAFIGGRFSFKKFNEIKEEAQRYVEDIKVRRDEADSLVTEINAEVASSDPSKASEVVKSVQQNPESSPIDQVVSEAILLQQQNRTDEAIEKWRSIANITEGIDDERAAQSWFSIGYLLHSKDEPDFDAAINAYDAALRLKPDFAEAYNNRGVARDILGQHAAAIADYDAALRLKPDYADTYNNRGVARRALGQHAAAIADYDAALRLNPNHADAYNNRGVARDALGQHAAAIADYDAALRLDPNHAKVYNNRGVARRALGQHAAAIADYDAAFRLNPDYAEAYNNRGISRDALGQHAAAIADYTAALRLNPDYADAYTNRGLVRYALGQYAAAIADYDSALRLNPNHADAYNNRGNSKDEIGRFDDAIADYTEALRLNPNSADAYYNRGNSKIKIGRFDDAIADYTEALRLNPDYADAYYNRGLVELQLNHIDEARQDFERALNLAQAMGNAELMKRVRLRLENLDRGDAP